MGFGLERGALVTELFSIFDCRPVQTEKKAVVDENS